MHESPTTSAVPAVPSNPGEVRAAEKADTAAQIAAFRDAVQAHEDGVRARLRASYVTDATYNECAASERRRNGGRLDNEILADALDGLDLSSDEWSTLRWFLSWDAQATIASIITKARAQSFEQAAQLLEAQRRDQVRTTVRPSRQTPGERAVSNALTRGQGALREAGREVGRGA